jgi:ribosome maturation factor RimP
MVREQELTSLLTPILDAMGYDMVRVQVTGTHNPTLQIMAERRDGVGMTVEDCAEISRAVSAVLEVEDPFDDAYALEVSSPGIDRPLVRLQDFDRFQGFDVRVELTAPFAGRKRFKGRLQGVAETNVVVEQDGERFELPFASIHRAKLILTDELIAAHQDKKA